MSVTARQNAGQGLARRRAGVLLLALVLAVGVVSGISAFATRLQHALTQESHRFLAADLVVRSSREMPWPGCSGRSGRIEPRPHPGVSLYGLCR